MPVSLPGLSPRRFACLLLALSLAGCGKPQPATDITVQLRVLETSDLHANIMDFNYYTGETDPSIGLARTATLIKQARAEVANSVLVDNGDLIQGSPLGDYIAYKGLAEGEVHPIFLAMNTLNYDVATLGNHEFNYGLPFMQQALAGANFPYISANVFCAVDACMPDKKQGDTLYAPYVIKPTAVSDTTGKSHQLNIGYIGLVPPQILLWDKQHLQQQVRVDSMLETAARLVPKMRAEGADLIIVIAHSGLGQTAMPVDPLAENLVYALTQLPGVDTVVFGHSHAVFPSERFASLPNTDIAQGLLHGIPAVMPGRWGDHLGVVDFTLKKQQDGWQVVKASAAARPVYNSSEQAFVAADTVIQQAVAAAHQGTLDFMQRPIGVAADDMYSFLAQIQDDPSVQIVADAQIARVSALLPPALQGMPVLSAAAPFKAGGRRSTASDAEQYIQVPKGTLSFRNAADLYLYPNTLVAVKATGAEIADWLECSANQFNQIDLHSSAPQQLINIEHPTYNFDVIDGVSYAIDISQPAKFDRNCELVAPEAKRIVNLRYTAADGTEYSGADFAAKTFIVATNNYRAFTGRFAGTGSDKVVLELPDTNREALVAYIEQQSQYDAASNRYRGAVNPAADHNWQLLPLQSDLALDIRFQSRHSAAASAFIAAKQRWPMTLLGTDDLGFAEYRVNLQP